jgi:isoquinoline 1-oxidoreductase subunit beta
MRRRTFLIGSVALAGGLAVGYRVWSHSFEREAARVAGPGEHLLAGWVKIGTDDTVTVEIPHIDMGQGTHTALAMLLAEELDADWSKVRTERAPGEKAFANRFLAQRGARRTGRIACGAGSIDEGRYAGRDRHVGRGTRVS